MHIGKQLQEHWQRPNGAIVRQHEEDRPLRVRVGGTLYSAQRRRTELFSIWVGFQDKDAPVDRDPARVQGPYFSRRLLGL